MGVEQGGQPFSPIVGLRGDRQDHRVSAHIHIDGQGLVYVGCRAGRLAISDFCSGSPRSIVTAVCSADN